MIVLLADANVELHVARLAAKMQAKTWREYWDSLGLSARTLVEEGLRKEDLDSKVGLPENGLICLNNRNDDGLTRWKRNQTENTLESLPVFISGADRFLQPRYADDVVKPLRYFPAWTACANNDSICRDGRHNHIRRNATRYAVNRLPWIARPADELHHPGTSLLERRP